MDLRTTISALRTGWHLLLAGALVAAAVAFVIDRTAVPVYEATASYVVSPGSGIPVDDAARGVDTLDSSRSRSIMTTLTEVVASEAVIADATTALGLSDDAAESYVVESVVVPEANVMVTSVTGPDPETAAALASTIGTMGGQRFVALYQIYDVGVLDAATIPTTTANPGLSQLLVIAVAIGLMAGAGAGLLRWAWLGRSSRSMRRRLGAYDSGVTSIEEHDRFKRVG